MRYNLSFPRDQKSPEGKSRIFAPTMSALVQTKLEQSPMFGHVFVFRGRRGDLIKLLWFDGDGLCLFSKRLERGRFIWPQVTSGTVSLTPAQLSMLLEGIDWRRGAARKDRTLTSDASAIGMKSSCCSTTPALAGKPCRRIRTFSGWCPMLLEPSWPEDTRTAS